MMCDNKGKKIGMLRVHVSAKKGTLRVQISVHSNK